MSEVRDNLPKAGLVYVTGRVYKVSEDPESTAHAVEIVYTR